MDEARDIYVSVEAMGDTAVKAALGLIDRFYLLAELLHRPDIYDPWLYARCREVEAEPDGCLDLWAREHYKSTIITFAGAIQEVLRDPNVTIGIFSHVGPLAKKFLAQIRNEFETNEDLKRTYPDVLWAEPKRQAPRWSLDAGLVVRRQTNPKEATLYASGLVDGMPTGAHFVLRIYDDVVTDKSVTTAEMVEKTTDAWELSDNLGTRGGSRAWHIGTRYSFADTYGTILDRGVLKPRIYPATHNGLKNGNPVFLSEEEWEAKKLKQPGALAAQLLQNPAAGEESTFTLEWLKPWEVRPKTLNVYIMGDPSKGRTSRSDYTAIAVVGIDATGNKYLLDGFRERMKLSRRWQTLKLMQKKWALAPGVLSVKVGWEEYGLQADLEYFEERMREEKYSFPIEPLNWPREGQHSKEDRVQRLQPDFAAGSFFLPARVWHETHGEASWRIEEFDGVHKLVYEAVNGPTRAMRRAESEGRGAQIVKALKRKDDEGRITDLTRAFIEEFSYFPFGSHDDLIDATSRIYDLEPVTPVIIDQTLLEPEAFDD